MWQQNYTPLLDSVGVSSLAAAAPIFVVLLLLGVFRKPAWMAAIAGLLSAIVLAAFVYGMPGHLILSASVYGAAFGLFPICWILFWAIVLYRITVDTGNFTIIKDSIGSLTGDRRLQALLIAFAFGAFIEGAAGFGAPVAVAAGMLAGLGFDPFFAAGICLLANTAPVAFGSIGIPVITLAGITGLPLQDLSANVGRICAPVSAFVPAYLVMVMNGWRGLKGVLPAAIACGFSFALAQFFVSNYLGPQLTDILGALAAMASLIILLRFWKPADALESERAVVHQHTTGTILRAWIPYLFLVVLVLLIGVDSIKVFLNQWTTLIPWPNLHNEILARASGGKGGRPIRCDVYAELLHGFGHGMYVRLPVVCPRSSHAVRGLDQGDHRLGEATRPAARYRSLGSRLGISDELLWSDRDFRTCLRGYWRPVPVLQLSARLARGLPHRQRHIGERPVW